MPAVRKTASTEAINEVVQAGKKIKALVML